jgi:uncharacterized oligopeptide transporter (OPT) family protein
MLAIGAGLGIGVVLLDEIMGALKLVRLPPLAVGIAIYLPMAATVAVIIGAVVGHFYNLYAARTKNPKRSERLGVLAASGMIVGESLFGVVTAGLIVATNKEAPLALVPADFAPANMIGLGVFAVLIIAIYAWMMRRARA